MVEREERSSRRIDGVEDLKMKEIDEASEKSTQGKARQVAQAKYKTRHGFMGKNN